jgi:Protein of unknown function (DUF1573)
MTAHRLVESHLSDGRVRCRCKRSVRTLIINSRISPLIVAMVLVCAAILKGYRLWEGGLLQSGFFESSTIQIGLSAMETALGFGLAFGIQLRLLRVATLGLFSAFLGFNLSHAVSGMRTCACFNADSSIWLTGGLDVAILLLMWFWHPAASPKTATERTAAPLAGYLGLGMLTLGIAGYSFERLEAGSSQTNLVVVGQERVEVHHPDRKKPLEVVFQLNNPTSRTIKVRRVYADCTCTATNLASTSVSPGETVPLVVRVSSFDSWKRSFLYRASVETDGGTLVVWLAGTLPVSDAVLFRPQELYLMGNETGKVRKVIVRVPRTCGRKLQPNDLALVNCPGGKVWLQQDPATPDHVEFTVHFVPPALDAVGTGAMLRVSTGCGSVDIPIRVLSKNPVSLERLGVSEQRSFQ